MGCGSSAPDLANGSVNNGDADTNTPNVDEDEVVELDPDAEFYTPLFNAEDFDPDLGREDPPFGYGYAPDDGDDNGYIGGGGMFPPLLMGASVSSTKKRPDGY
jgi:hypothetical protein